MALTEQDKKEYRAYAALVDSEGWKMFQEYIQNVAAIFQNKAFNAANPHEMAMNMGAYNAVKNLHTWALSNAMQYKSHLLQSKETPE